MYIDHHFGRRPFEHFKVMHSDDARREVDFFAFTSHFIGLASLHFYGGIGRGSLLDLTHKSFEGFFKLLFRDVDWRLCRSDFAFGVEGISSTAHSDNGLIAFIGGGNVFTQSHGWANKNDEYAGSARVEGAGMSGAAQARAVANRLYYIVRGHAYGLIHYQYTGDGVLNILTVHFDSS